MAESGKKAPPAWRREHVLSDFQTRYITPFAVFVLVTLVLFSLFMVLRSRSVVFEQVGSDQITSALSVAQGLGQSFELASDVLENIAGSPAALSTKPRDAAPLLKGYIKNLPTISSLYIFDTAGNVLTSTDTDDSRALSMLNDPCYENISKNAKTCFSNIVNETNGLFVTYVYAPVFDPGAGSLVRVVAGSVPVGKNPFKSIVMSANPGRHGYAVLVDRSGNVALNGNPSAQGGTPENLMNVHAVKQALAGNKGVERLDMGGRSMFAAYVPVEGPGWALLLQRPTGEVGGTAGNIVLCFVFVILGGIGAVVIAVMQSQGVTRFLFQLSGRLDSLIKGGVDLDLRGIDDEGGELTKISSAFNRMLRNVREDRRNSEASLREALDTARFNQNIVDSLNDMLIVVGPNMEVQTANDAAAAFCNVHPTAMPGRPIGSFGSIWNRREVEEAIKDAVRRNAAAVLTGIRLPFEENEANDTLELRVYPFHGHGLSKPDGALILGYRYSPELKATLSESENRIGDLTASQERLRRSEKFFREMFRDMNDTMLMLEPAGRIEWGNLAACKLLGTDSNGIQQMNFLDTVNSEHRSAFEERVQRTLNTGSYMPPFEIRIRAGQEQRLVEVSLSRAAADGGSYKLVVSLREVPKQRTVERMSNRDAIKDRERLEKKIQFLTSVFNATPTALALTGADGRIIQVNAAFETLFGDRREVFSGKNIITLHTGAGRFLSFSNAHLLGLQHLEAIMRTHKGAEFLSEAWAAPLPGAPGDGPALLCAFREIGSERAAAEQEKRRVRADTMSAISRDIANRLYLPINDVVRSLQELGGNLFSDENRSLWWHAMRGGRALNQSVNMMLMFAGEQPLKTKPCHMSTLIEETLEAMDHHKMIPDNLKIAADCTSDIPPIQADPEQMKMVLWNLVHNAIQAVDGQPDAEVQITAYARDIKGRPMAVVEILDSGPEYDTKQITKFFDPFYGKFPGGVGLGLPLCRRAIERQGGRIGIERKQGFTRASFAISIKNLPKSAEKPAQYSKQTLN